MRFAFKTHDVEVNVATAEALHAQIADRLNAGDGFALATLNLDHLVKLRASEGFRQAYAAQDFVVADGNPIVWLSKLARRPVDLLPGSELVLPLARQASESGWPIGLVGSTDEVLLRAEEALRRDVPGLEVAVRIAPPMGFDPTSSAADDLLAALRASGARLAFLALGAPKQEMLAARGRDRAPLLGFVSVGAGLDFLAGVQTRAPRWVRALAMEWLWRMLSNPGRLALRYLRCMAILPGLVLRAWRMRT